MSEAFWTAFWVGLPVSMTSAAAAWVSIRQTNLKAKEINEKTEQKAAETNAKVDEVAKNTNGNVSRLNDLAEAQRVKIDELHEKIVTTSVQAEANKTLVPEKKEP